MDFCFVDEKIHSGNLERSKNFNTHFDKFSLMNMSGKV